jgi:hypothetical protein
MQGIEIRQRNQYVALFYPISNSNKLSILVKEIETQSNAHVYIGTENNCCTHSLYTMISIDQYT